MSCENVQELISPLVDRRVPDGEREEALSHLESCRQCCARFESMQNTRQAMRGMNSVPVPVVLAANLRVMASHERARNVARASLASRLRYWTDRVRLSFDNLMRPLALPFGGGLLSAVVLFSILVPSLTIQHDESDMGLVTDPYGQVVVVGPVGLYAPDTNNTDLPRIEPIYADYQMNYPEDSTVVWLAIGENGKVQGYSVATGKLTADMISIISLSKFHPATFLGVPTPGVVKMVQRNGRRSMRS